MAITFVSTRGFVNNSVPAAAINLTMTTGASITPGNTLILGVSYRDVATPPTDARPQPGDALAIDQRGNLWRREASSINQGATTAADDGAVVEIWVCHVVFPYQNNDLLTLTSPISGFPVSYLSANLFEYFGVKRVSHPYSSLATTGNGTAVSVTPISVAQAGQLVFCTAAMGGNVSASVVGDSDTLDGVWGAVNVSNGTDITRAIQTKLVTGTSDQSWNITWTGTQRWAAAAIVMEQLETAWPFNNEHLANPEFPCPAGPQIIPVARTLTPVDTGTAYIFEADLPPESSDTESMFWYSNLATTDPAADSQHLIVAEVYPRGQEQVLNPPVVVSLGVPNVATLGNGATTTDAAPNGVAALATVGGTQVILETQQIVDCSWDTSALAPYADNYRIVDVRINYVAWKDNAAAPEAGEGMAVYWRDATAVGATAASRVTSLYGAWLVNEYESTAKRTFRSLGEINGVPRIGATSFVNYTNLYGCFTIQDFLRMQTAQTMITFFGLSGSAPSQETVFLDTVELQLVLVPERRLAAVCRRVNSGVGFPGSTLAPLGASAAPFYDATDTLNFWRTPTYYPGTDVQAISMVVREAVPASPSDWFSAQYDPDNANANFGQNLRYASQERVGPSAAMRTVVQPRETLDSEVSVSRVAWTDGQIAANAVPMAYGQFLQATTMIDANSYSAAWPAYSYDNALETGASISSGPTMLVATGTGSTYDYLRVIVSPPDNPNSADLTITVEQPALTVLASATLTWADVAALPVIANGYREVLVPLTTPVTPSATTAVTIRFTSLNPNNDPWIPAYAYAENGSERYVYQPFPLVAPTEQTDYAVMLCCPLADVDASIETTEISTQDSGTNCIVRPQDIPCITVDNATDYDWITIERTVSGIERAPLALIDVNSELTYPALEVYDDFSRVNLTNWGSATSGQPWVEITLGAAVATSVDGLRGIVTPAAAATAWYGNILSPSADTVQEMLVDIAVAPTGGTVLAALRARSTSTSITLYNAYELYVRWNLNGSIDLLLGRADAGVTALLSTYQGLVEYTPGTGLRVKFSVIGDQIRAKGWLETQSEPDWQMGITDATYSAAGYQGPAYASGTGNTSSDRSAYFYEYAQYSYAEQPITFCDYGVPWDVESGQIEYYVTGYRDVDRRVTAENVLVWNGVSTAPGAAFGIATDDALYSYVPGSDSGPLQVTWNPLTPQDSLPLAGKDYQIALRPVENRGLATTVNVIVNKFNKCVTCIPTDEGIYNEDLPYNSPDSYNFAGGDCPEEGDAYDDPYPFDSEDPYDYPGGSFETITPGAQSMAPTPYEEVLGLERLQRVRLKLPGGHSRWVFVDTGALTIIPVVGYYAAELTFVDTPPLSIDPWE